jgi:hypothetical protein
MRKLSQDESFRLAGGVHICHAVAGAWGLGIGTVSGAVTSVFGTPAVGFGVGLGAGVASYAAGVQLFCDVDGDATSRPHRRYALQRPATE